MNGSAPGPVIKCLYLGHRGGGSTIRCIKIAASGNLPIIEKTVAVVTENLSERIAVLETAAAPEQSATFYAVGKSDDDAER